MVLPGSTPYQNFFRKARGYGKSYQNIHNCRKVWGRENLDVAEKDAHSGEREAAGGTDATSAPFVRHSGSQGQTGAELLVAQ